MRAAVRESLSDGQDDTFIMKFTGGRANRLRENLPALWHINDLGHNFTGSIDPLGGCLYVHSSIITRQTASDLSLQLKVVLHAALYAARDAVW